MVRYGEAERFASRLRALRERADYSYEALAQKTGVSRSSLHRYCTGSSVPQDYGTAHRIATVCGATPAELRELHRLWALAGMERGERAVPEEGQAGTGTAEKAKETAGAATGAMDAAPESQEAPETVGASAAVETQEAPAGPVAPSFVVEVTETASPSQAGRRLSRGRSGRRTAVTAVVTAVVLVTAAWGVSAISSRTESPSGTASAAQDHRLLFATGCKPVVSMGQQDKCVREVQRQLERHGAKIGVDSSYGPETLRRVTAFQVLADIIPNGVVGASTKKALYESRVRMDTWPPEKVRERIREVFTEAPGDAVSVADCQSFLDPLHILPNTNGSRNWGLFQISDKRLRELGGTPRMALDPEWNIRAAKRLWSQKRDFRDWPHCARSLRPTPSAAPSATGSSATGSSTAR